jgi:hypothetical protein
LKIEKIQFLEYVSGQIQRVLPAAPRAHAGSSIFFFSASPGAGAMISSDGEGPV